MIRRSEIPVGELYVVAFLILVGLAGMSLYLFLNSQSTATDYRIAAASILEISEEFKKFIDQERRYVIETVLFFLGSQGGIDNIADYNSVDLALISDPLNPNYDAEARACYDLLRERLKSPSEELIQRCFNGKSELYKNPDSQGVWKCDSYIYSFETCEDISWLAAKTCCDSLNDSSTYVSIKNLGTLGPLSGVTGQVCHEGCMQALEGASYKTKCSNLDYCGALWCKNDNLEIPESFTGVSYYYKIGDNGPGYYCPSSYTFSAEKYYEPAELWEGSEISSIITQLINLANNYFYTPSPQFMNYLKTYFGSDAEVTFQLDFRGCNNEMCEFAWVPYGETEQSFIARGFGGVPMMEFSAELVSLQTIPIPIEDMIAFSRGIISAQDIKNYLVSSLEEMTFNPHYEVSSPFEKTLADWREVFGSEVFDINCEGAENEDAGKNLETPVFSIYDNRSCGDDPYNGDCNYDCLMQHASTNLYMATSTPFTYDRTDAYDYTLRPVFRFIETSLGASIIVEGSGTYAFDLLPGSYNIFINGQGETEANLNFASGANPSTFSFSHFSAGDYYEALTGPGEVGVCAYAEWDGQSLSNYEASGFGCCHTYDYDESTKTCTGSVSSNTYCNQINNKYGKTLSGKACSFKGVKVDYNNMLIFSDAGTSNTRTLQLTITNGSINSIDIVRVDYDNTMDVVSVNGANYGGSYEYYWSNETSDCESPIGEDFTDYSTFTDEELWYSILCLRGQDYSWPYIISNMTGLYNRFKEVNYDGDNYLTAAENMEEFLELAGSVCVEKHDNGYLMLRFGNLNCNDEAGIKRTLVSFTGFSEVFLSSNNSIISGLDYAESQAAFNTAQDMLQRLYEIQLNTSYVSLPLKWSFAYRDSASFDQTAGNIGADSGCNLNYETFEGSRAEPDCGCKNCNEVTVCDMDFVSVSSDTLYNNLYRFYEIFVQNDNYQMAGVVR